VSDEDLRQAAVVIVNDVPVPVGLARRLVRFVEGGGGLFVAVGSRTTWPQEADLLPAVAGAPVDRTRGEAARLGALEYGHPVFEVFRAPRSGDFSTARFYGYRAVVPGQDTQILARFDGGAPALVERRVGRGRVLEWASTFDLAWSDLPLKPVFLPFVHRAVRHLAAYSEPPPWLTVGQVLDPGSGAETGGRVALAPSGRRIPLDEEGTDVLELTEPGFYEVRRGGGQGSNAEVTVVASNVDPSESDLTPMDPQEIVAATVGGPGDGTAARENTPLPPEAQERTQRLWWYLLCLGIALLAADTVLSNRLSKA
jgi:hypothetical protein